VGAQLWYHKAPWREDPEEALRALQAQVLREKYDLPTVLKEHIDSAREAVRLSEADDPYDLLEFYRQELDRLEQLASRPIPNDPRRQVEVVRRVFASSGQGVGDVLDVTGVSRRGGVHVAKRLAAKEVRRLCGVERPDLNQARAAVPKINEELGRGESVCFSIYAAKGTKPAGWYFVGNTID
jgi:hypothetical protein